MNKRMYWALIALMSLMVTAPLSAEDFKATLQWSQRVELSTLVSGVVSNALVHVGDYVRKGQPLLQLDERSFKAQVEKAGADVTRLSVVLDEAKRELRRAEELYDRMVLSDHALQMARIGFLTAESEYQAAQAALVQAGLDMEYSVVRAPYDGLILKRQVEIGQTIVNRLQSTPLFVLAESGRMLARAQVTHEELSELSSGKKASVIVAGKTYQGIIKTIGLEPESVQAGRALYVVDVEFSFDPAITLRAGQTAKVTFPSNVKKE